MVIVVIIIAVAVVISTVVIISPVTDTNEIVAKNATTKIQRQKQQLRRVPNANKHKNFFAVTNWWKQRCYMGW